jgi:hypothetical protein
VIVEWATDHGDAPRQNHREAVETEADLDAVLDGIQNRGIPQMVDLFPADESDTPAWESTGLQIGLGHPSRAFVWFSDGTGADFGYEPELAPVAEEITFDYGGVPTGYDPTRTRVSPATARRAAREFLQSMERLTHVRWLGSAGEPSAVRG